MKNNFVALSIFVLAFLFVADVSAQPMRHGGKSHGKCSKMGQLKLTDEQQNKFDALKETHFNEVSKLKDELDKMRIDKRALMRSDNTDRAKVLDLTKKMNDVKGKIALSGDNFRLDVLEMLTDEQKKDFQMFGPRHDRMGSGMRPEFKHKMRGFQR